MKIKSSLLAAAVSVAVATPVFAIVPAAADTSPLNFGIVAEDGYPFHFGVYASAGTRGMEQHGRKVDMDINRYSAFFGVDVARWITVYATLGMLDCEPDFFDVSLSEESSLMYGVGAWFNLFDSEEFDLFSTVTRYRFLANAEYIMSDFDDYDWMEFNASLVFALHNEIVGRASEFIDEVGIYAGPCLSYIDSDSFESQSGNDWGMTAGVNLMFGRSTYLTVGGDFFRDGSLVFGSLGLRF